MIEKCHYCNKEVDYDLEEGLYCADCAEIILHEQFEDFFEEENNDTTKI